MAARPGRPMVAIDLAVPRNVDPLSRHIPGLHLYDMDDLVAVAVSNHAVAACAVAAADAAGMAMVATGVRHFRH